MLENGRDPPLFCPQQDGEGGKSTGPHHCAGGRALLSSTKKMPLCLRHSGIFLVGAGGFEPPKSSTTDLQSAPFGHSGTLPCRPTKGPIHFLAEKRLELVDGLEPPTC